MPDMIMCLNSKCEMSKRCFRYSAKPAAKQSYRMFNPSLKIQCRYYMPMRMRDVLNDRPPAWDDVGKEKA